MDEEITQPSHYTQGSVECIDAMVSAFGEDAVKDYCRLNAFKYVWRAKHKDSVESNTLKAIWFLRWSIGDDPRKQNK
jgi:hypothetical protein